MEKVQPSVLPQYLTAFAACLGGFSIGTIIGYSSPAGPLLTNGTDSVVQLTDEQNGIFSSMSNLGALIGAPIAGYCISAFGRKPTMIFSIVPFLLGWGLIAGGQNYAMLLIGRFVSGTCCGISSMTVPTYISEFSSAHIRGALTGGFQLMVVTGIFATYCLGPFIFNFRTLAIICAVPSVVYCIAVLFCKESPPYLLSRNRVDEAKNSLQFFRGPQYNISKEMEEIQMAIDESKRTKRTIKDLKTPYILKPFLISLAIMFFQQFSGINAVIFNLSIIFKAAGSTLSDKVAPIVIGLAQVVGTLVAVGLIDRFGRKILLILSAGIMAVSLVALGVYFNQLEYNESFAKTINWLPIVSLSVFIIAFSIGYGPIPWVIMGEVFTPDIKAMAASIATMTNWTCAFLTTVFYHPLSALINEFGVFWFFGAICLLNMVFCFLFVMETKGKTLEEITVSFGGPILSPASRRRMSQISHIAVP